MSAAPWRGVDAPRVAEWAERARTAGHPVIEVRPGRFHPIPQPAPVAGMAPNDALDIDRHTARNRIPFVHALMPSPAALLALGEALSAPPAPPARRGRWGLHRRRAVRVPGVGPLAVTESRDGVVVHALEVPVAWLDQPVIVIRRPPARTVATR